MSSFCNAVKKKKKRMEYQMSSEEGVFKRQIIESNTQIG